MRYVARVGGREVVVDRGTDGRCSVDGTPVEAALRGPPGGPWSLAIAGAVHAVDVHDDGDGVTVTLGSRAYRVVLEDERERAAHAVRPGHATGPRVLRSAMPGIVRRVLVAPGATVEARRPLLVLEAMKMQNEVRADRDGVVDRIHVEPGATVNRGDALVTLRAPAP